MPEERMYCNAQIRLLTARKGSLDEVIWLHIARELENLVKEGG